MGHACHVGVHTRSQAPRDDTLEPLIQTVGGGGRAWCPTLVIPALGRERQEEW